MGIRHKLGRLIAHFWQRFLTASAPFHRARKPGKVRPMALSSTTSELSFTGNNSTSTAYALTNLRFDDAAWLTVTETDSGGTVTTLTNGVEFNLGGDGSAGTGTLTSTSGNAIPATSTLKVTRNTPATQTVDLENDVPLDHESLETQLDKQIMLVQDTQRAVSSNTSALAGFGTIATQDANSVAITGGSITGITDLAVADGGTGASTASGARTNLGLGNMALQTDSSVAILGGTMDAVGITGGTIDGLTTPLAVLDGGTGATTASGARTNLGLAIGSDVQAFDSVLAATTASFTTADETKLDGIEASADVTDTANVTAAGALMDSEVGSLSGIKTLTVPDSTTISSFGASLVDDADASAARTTLGLAIGTNVESQKDVITTTPVSAANVTCTAYIDQTQVMTPAASQSFVVLVLPSAANSRLGQIVRFVSTTEDISNVTVAVSGSGTVSPAWSNTTLTALETLTYQCIDTSGNGTWIRIIQP